MGILKKIFGLTPLGHGFNKGSDMVANSQWAKDIEAKQAVSDAAWKEKQAKWKEEADALKAAKAAKKANK